MKILLPLLLSAALVHAQTDDPPILKPALDSAEIESGGVRNKGTLPGEFSGRKAVVTISIVPSDRGTKVLKLEPTADASKETLLLPCLVYRNMPEEFPNGVTFQARIKPDPAWQLPQTEILSGRVSDRGTGMALSFRPTDRLVDVVSGSGDTEGDVWGIISNLQAKITTDGWTHVAAVYDAEKKQFRLYFDGQMIAESATDLALTPMSKNLTIGAYRAGYTYPFRGEITDIAVYDYARSEDQIQADAK